MSNIMWECKCGHIEYREEPPEDCPKCLRINNFAQVPEDLIEEKTRGLLMDEKDSDFKDDLNIDDLSLDEIPRSKIKKQANNKNSKLKSKIKKTRKRK